MRLVPRSIILPRSCTTYRAFFRAGRLASERRLAKYGTNDKYWKDNARKGS